MLKKAESVYAECVALGYGKSLTALIEEKRETLRALSTEDTLEVLREKFAVRLESKDVNKPAQAKLIRQLYFPWENQKLGAFLTRPARAKAIEEIEIFLSLQYNFLNGEPWSVATRVSWISRFCLLGDYAISRSLTDLPGNFFRAALTRPKFELSPVIFLPEELQEFMTYVRYWYPDEYVGLLLGTKGCIRVEEISKMTWEMIELKVQGAGTITLPVLSRR